MRDIFVKSHHTDATTTRAEASRAAELVYWLHLSERRAPNLSTPLGGHVWSFLPVRQDTYEKLRNRAVENEFGGDTILWATFLGEEIRGLRRTQALADSLAMSLRGPDACQDSAKAISVALAPTGFQRSLRHPMRCWTLWRAGLTARPPSTSAELFAYVEHRIWRWAEACLPTWGELHLPIVFIASTSVELARLRAGEAAHPLSHVGYLGIRAHLQGSASVLHIRVDDSWHLPCLTAVSKPTGAAASRARLYAPTVIVPKRALAAPTVAALLRPLLRCVQPSSEGFRGGFFALASNPDLQRLGGGRSDTRGIRRPLAAQEGPCCLVKNHNRGVAARLDAFLSDRAQAAGLASGPEASRRLWQWLKAQERAAARDLVACQIESDR